jgi:hypothetical protein
MLSVPSSSEYLSTKRPLADANTKFAILTASDQQNGMRQLGGYALENLLNSPEQLEGPG